jgi:pyroglutamyl-peptidase
MSIVISGFQPFGNFAINLSEQVALHFGGISLPVVRYKSFDILKETIHVTNPLGVIMIGIAGGSDKIRLERIAINLDDYSIPDNEGNQPKEEKIIHNAPDAYFSTLPLRIYEEKLRQVDIPVQYSLSAGSYLCNHLFYQVMHYISEQKRNIPAGFIHIPETFDLRSLITAFDIIIQNTV